MVTIRPVTACAGAAATSDIAAPSSVAAIPANSFELRVRDMAHLGCSGGLLRPRGLTVGGRPGHGHGLRAYPTAAGHGARPEIAGDPRGGRPAAGGQRDPGTLPEP
ncbi:hypothetical protein CS0771_30120 [Catellatospora sp. IY07-71]|nr:hypothetical protein CS0771_30120 [Catellatospora sp. IY07-71]